jgi:hypothetical protein
VEVVNTFSYEFSFKSLINNQRLLFILVGLGFETKASHLQNRHSILEPQLQSSQRPFEINSYNVDILGQRGRAPFKALMNFTKLFAPPDFALFPC